MTDTVISGSSGDAVKFPHDEGLPNIPDGSETWDSAGYQMALAQAVDGGSYVRSDSELTFTGHDGTNDQVDVTAGIAYLDLTGETVDVQSNLGGNSPPDYDTTLPTLPSIMVVVPTAKTNLSVSSATLNDIWLAYATDGTVTGVSAGDVYLRHGSGLSAPPHPSVKLGQANPDDSSADVLENRLSGVGVTYHQSSEPVYQERATWIDPNTGILRVGYDAGGGGDYHPVPPVTVLDEATSFDGSDGETVSHTDTRVSGGSIELALVSSTSNRPADNASQNDNAKYGVIVNPNSDLTRLEAVISGSNDAVPSAYLVRDSDGTTLETVDISGKGAGETVTFTTDLSTGTDYRVLMDNNGSSWGHGEYTSPSFPYSSTHVDITSGYGAGSSTTAEVYCWSDVTGYTKATSGSATVSWAAPVDIESWDLATFQRTLAGETVTIDVLDGSDTVLFSDISQNFDISTVNTSKVVKIRANLSRSDTSNNPTLDYAARRHLR